jgi:hypothetical protein
VRDGRFGLEPKNEKRISKWLRCNQGVGVIMTVMFTGLLIYIQLTPGAHRKLRDKFTLGFFPTLAVALLILFSLILIFDSRRREILPRLEKLTILGLLGAVLTVVVSFGYFAFMLETGFLIATPVFLLFAMYALGLKPWRNIIIAALFLTAIVYAIFTLMGIELWSCPY